MPQAGIDPPRQSHATTSMTIFSPKLAKDSIPFFIQEDIEDTNMGDPKTKFLRLFWSAVRPSVRPKKTFLDSTPVRRPPSDLGPMLY